MFKCLRRTVFIAFALAGFSPQASAQATEPDELSIYIDADFSVTRFAAEAIMMGLETALAEVDFQIAGKPVRILPKDHRGSPKRSRATMAQFDADPSGLAMIGGMESPPYLSYGAFVNQSGIPLLLPWSAAGPITRMAEGPENYIFRLSVDDTKAGAFLVGEAKKRDCRAIALLLVDTGWGRANRTTMTQALDANAMAPAIIAMLSPDTGPAAARTLARDVSEAGADCVILVMPPDAGGQLLVALNELATDVQVLSHWGILGGRITQTVPHDAREQLRLRVLQTCGLDVEANGNERLAAALASARDRGHDVDDLSSVAAPAGFVHGYDLGRILISATGQASASPGWAGDPAARRQALKEALEALETPVAGILDAYSKPFAVFEPANPDAHEALGIEDLCLAKFAADGRLTTLDQSDAP